jgi:hypothetical protein
MPVKALPYIQTGIGVDLVFHVIVEDREVAFHLPGVDRDVYLLLDDFGGSRGAWRQTDVGRHRF